MNKETERRLDEIAAAVPGRLNDQQLQTYVKTIKANIESALMLAHIVEGNMTSNIWPELKQMLDGMLTDKDCGLNGMLADWEGFWEE